MLKPYYQDEAVTIYHADCREVLPSLSADCLITDPPYGVMLGEANNGQRREKNQQPYSQFSDTPEYLESVVIPAVISCLQIVGRGLVFCGVRNLQSYPKSDDFGVWYVPAGAGIGKWGFICAHPILYYGNNPHHGVHMSATSYRTHKPIAEKNGHPCPKPLGVMKWAVGKVSVDSDCIIDPFMGSGTTLRAAKDLGRKAIGIEIEEKYCEIAARRMAQEVLDFATA